MISVTHATPAVSANNPAKEVSKDAWNEGHLISGLATVAETGAYSDLTGKPTLGTAAAAATTDFDAAGVAAAAIVTHVGLADPHAQYALESSLGTLATQSGTFSGTSSGTNTGDQASIVGITGTIAQFNTACTDADFASGGGTATGTNTGDQTITLTGNVTGSGTGSFAATIANGAVTLAKMENRATQTFIGRNTAGSGVPEELSVATAKTMLALTGTNSGDQTITLTGDVTGAGAGSFAATIANNAVTDAKFRQGVARSVVGVTGNATANTADLQGATDTVLRVNGAGTAVAFGAIDLSKIAAATGVLQAASFPALTGDVTTVAGALAATIGAGRVTRAMLAADAKNWTLLGTATATNAVRSGTITWAGTFEELWFEYFIAGYSNTAIGRLIVGPTAGLSETATNHCCSLIEGVTLTATSVSIPGWPTAVTVNNVERYGSMFVKNVAGQVKRMWGHGNHAGTAATAVPLQMLFGGLMSDATNAINKAELAVYAAITGAAISAITFTSATLNVWGRHAD